MLRGGDGDPGMCTGASPSANTTAVGITTAAHCSNYPTFQGFALPFVDEAFYDSGDVQWHLACPYTEVTNEFNSGLGYRGCTGARGRADQTVGTYVCKWGTTTGRTCGYIQSRHAEPSYVPNSDEAFVRVNGYGAVLRAPGDSGSPWFPGDHRLRHQQRAYSDGDAIYMRQIPGPDRCLGAAYNPTPACVSRRWRRSLFASGTSWISRLRQL